MDNDLYDETSREERLLESIDGRLEELVDLLADLVELLSPPPSGPATRIVLVPGTVRNN